MAICNVIPDCLNIPFVFSDDRFVTLTPRNSMSPNQPQHTSSWAVPSSGADGDFLPSLTTVKKAMYVSKQAFVSHFAFMFYPRWDFF